MSTNSADANLTAANIERNPAFANEHNLAWLVERVVEVFESEGADLGGYDCNLQSYYENTYSVHRNDEVFEAIGAIARINPTAFTESVRTQLRARMGTRIEYQVTTSNLQGGTSYVSDTESIVTGGQQRDQILREVEALFAS